MGPKGTDGVQSRDLCFPLQVMIENDNKELLHSQFKPFYTEVNEFEDKHRYLNIAYHTHWSFSIAHPADMLALQKLVCRGEAMKNFTYACYCCNIHIDQVHLPNLFPCDFCTAHDKDDVTITKFACQNCGRGLKKNLPTFWCGTLTSPIY